MDSRAVLVVDDEATMRFCLERLLRGAGFEVTTAADATAALDAVERSPPAAVVVDVALDGALGRTLCSQLRQSCARKDLKILILSARAEFDGAERGLAAGADGYLTKPVSIGLLTQRLTSLLGHVRA